MKFTDLTTINAETIAWWFDDPDTQRYLGDQAWLYRAIDLVQTAPGSTWDDVTVLGRHLWIAGDRGGACGLVDLEIYDNGSAALALVVAPHRRNHGVGQQILTELTTRPELSAVTRLFGSIEPDNLGAQRCCIQAGFHVDQVMDADGLFPVEKWLSNH
ncbi:MAG: GNAT family N-acetyltransferase [Caldilineaceae bacterium]|nr:GNAT family N-acetyltransferase [Caldilineaceae bacterium]